MRRSDGRGPLVNRYVSIGRKPSAASSFPRLSRNATSCADRSVSATTTRSSTRGIQKFGLAERDDHRNDERTGEDGESVQKSGGQKWVHYHSMSDPSLGASMPFRQSVAGTWNPQELQK